MLNSLFSSLIRTSRRQALVVQQFKALSSRPPDEDNDEELLEWIPPNRPLVGDKGQPDLHAGNEEEKTATDTSNQSMDWLATRRTKQSEITMGIPNKSRRFAGAELDVLPGVLLSSKEIEQCLIAMGGLDYFLKPDDENRTGGVDGVILVTATSSQHLYLMTDTLVRQLKQRNLHNFGVDGAARSSKRARDHNETWVVVDCDNYVVHIILEDARRHLNLEALWSGEDDLLNLDFLDEKAVDDYVARNPVPEGYGVVESEDVTATISRLERFNDMKRNIKSNTKLIGSKGKAR